MKIFYLSIVLFLLINAYFLFLPLFKKRPIVLKHIKLIIYFLVLAVILYRFLGIWILVITGLAITFLFILKPWFVYGVTSDMLSEALEKAANITRTPYKKLTNEHKIDEKLRVKRYFFNKKITIILFRKIAESKKTKLTIVVFSKFIQNLFI